MTLKSFLASIEHNKHSRNPGHKSVDCFMCVCICTKPNSKPHRTYVTNHYTLQEIFLLFIKQMPILDALF